MTVGCIVLLALQAAAPSGPAGAVRYAMQQVWSIDAERGDDVVFGQIEDVVVDHANTAYVLDGQLDHVMAFDATGTLLRTLGRAGDGPGEFRSPGSLVLMPDGSLGVVSRQYSRITKIDPATGDPRGELVLEGVDSPIVQIGRVRPVARQSDPPLLVAVVGEPQTRRRGNLEYRVRLYMAAFPAIVGSGATPPLGQIMEVGMTKGSDIEEEDYYRLWDPWAIDSSSLIVAAPYWSEYEIRYMDLEGGVRRTVRRPFEHRERLDHEKNRLLDYLWGGISPAGFGVELVPSDTEAAVRSIYPRPGGEIWVRTSLSGWENGPGVFAVLDAFGPDGTYRGEIELIGPGDEGLDRVHFGADGYVIVVHGAERFIRSPRGRHDGRESHELRLAGYRLVEMPHPSGGTRGEP